MKYTHLKSLLVTKLVSRVLPVRPDGQVIHGEGRVPGNILLHLEEGREGVHQLLVIECGECLQENQSLTSGMTRSSVQVQLVLLVL